VGEQVCVKQSECTGYGNMRQQKVKMKSKVKKNNEHTRTQKEWLTKNQEKAKTCKGPNASKTIVST